MSDIFNGLMVIPNLLAVLAFSGVVAKFVKDDDTLTGKLNGSHREHIESHPGSIASRMFVYF